MKKKTPVLKKTKTQSKISHPGMMGDGTEEQNLGVRGNPAARIKKKDVTAAFGQKRRKKITLMTGTFVALAVGALEKPLCSSRLRSRHAFFPLGG